MPERVCDGCSECAAQQEPFQQQAAALVQRQADHLRPLPPTGAGRQRKWTCGRPASGWRHCSQVPTLLMLPRARARVPMRRHISCEAQGRCCRACRVRLAGCCGAQPAAGRCVPTPPYWHPTPLPSSLLLACLPTRPPLRPQEPGERWQLGRIGAHPALCASLVSPPCASYYAAGLARQWSP